MSEIRIGTGGTRPAFVQAEQTYALRTQVVFVGKAGQVEADDYAGDLDDGPLGTRATETDAALGLGYTRTFTVGRATETSTGLAVSPFRKFPVGQAEETSAVIAMTVIGGDQTVEIGQVSESDNALSVRPVSIVAVGQASSSSSASPITALQITYRSIGQASESDLARALTQFVAASTITLGRAVQTELARGIGGGAQAAPGEHAQVIRWRFTDEEAEESAILILNPNKMSTPTFTREVTYGWTPARGFAGVDRSQGQPTSWTFEGAILTKAHYDQLLEWSQRGVVLRVDDHLGRSFGIIIEKYDPIERYPTATRPWRADYTMTCLLLEVIEA